METIKVETVFGTFKLREYYDILKGGNSEHGISVYKGRKKVMTLPDISIPDPDDPDYEEDLERIIEIIEENY